MIRGKQSQGEEPSCAVPSVGLGHQPGATRSDLYSRAAMGSTIGFVQGLGHPRRSRLRSMGFVAGCLRHKQVEGRTLRLLSSEAPPNQSGDSAERRRQRHKSDCGARPIDAARRGLWACRDRSTRQ
jgi:hypothetical protein